MSLRSLPFSYHNGACRVYRTGEGLHSLHVSSDPCLGNSSLGLLLLPEATLGSLKPLSQFLVTELSSLCQGRNVAMCGQCSWWVGQPPFHRVLLPGHCSHYSQVISSLVPLPAHPRSLRTRRGPGTPLPTLSSHLLSI